MSATTATRATAKMERIAAALDAHPALSVEDRAHLYRCIGAAHGPAVQVHWEAARRAKTCRGRSLRVAALFHNLDLLAGRTPNPRQILETLEKEAGA